MNLQTYFQPLSSNTVSFAVNNNMPSLGQYVKAYWEGMNFPDVGKARLVLMGVDDDRLSVRNARPKNILVKDGVTSPEFPRPADKVRNRFYALALPSKDFSCVDLGNMIIGDTPEDTIFALSEILADLLEKKATVVILGGSQALSFANYKAYESIGRVVNVANIDSRFDVEQQTGCDSRSWIYNIIMQQPNYLFNFASLGYQSYLCGTALQRLMDELQFDTIRLGELQGEGMMKAEPLLRWSDMVSVDIGAVRRSDAPANTNASIHGFYGEQLCQLMRFAGLSDKVSTLGFYEYNTVLEQGGQTADLIAQALWHFVEGFFARMGDFPYKDVSNYRRYLVPLNSGRQEIVFYKSRKSDRWWMQVPCDIDENKDRYERHLIVPCTYEEYQQALENEVPTRWMKVLHRVN